MKPRSALSNWSLILECVSVGTFLVLASGLALITHLPVYQRHGAIIDEYDPNFQFRITAIMQEAAEAENSLFAGIRKLYGLFDPHMWYPLGRHVGETIYPGMLIAALMAHRALSPLFPRLTIHDLCYFFPTVMMIPSVLLTYALTAELSGLVGPALLAAALMASSAIHHDVGGTLGGYDLQCVTTFLTPLVVYFWAVAIRTASIFAVFAAVAAYAALAMSWGGHVYVLNLVALHVAIAIAARMPKRAAIAESYLTFFGLGFPLALLTPVIRARLLLQTSAAFPLALFGCILLHKLWDTYRTATATAVQRLSGRAWFVLGASAIAALAVAATLRTSAGLLIDDRVWHFFGAKANSGPAIVSSVSEHTPAQQDTILRYFSVTVFFIMQACLDLATDLDETSLLALLFFASGFYLFCAMWRMLTVFTIIRQTVAALGASAAFCSFGNGATAHAAPRKRPPPKSVLMTWVLMTWALRAIVFMMMMRLAFRKADVIMPNEQYHLLILPMTDRQGGHHFGDDYREGYQWLRMNTPPDAKVLSWWDYGYQINRMGNRTTIVDNYTANYTQISEVGLALISEPHVAYRIAHRYEASYVLVIGGDHIAYRHGDSMKMPWIAAVTADHQPMVRRSDYVSGWPSTPGTKLAGSLIMRICRYVPGKTAPIPGFSKAFFSANGIVRIFRVDLRPNRYLVDAALPGSGAESRLV